MNEVKKVKLQAKNGERLIQEVMNLLYKKQDYKGICKIYKKESTELKGKMHNATEVKLKYTMQLKSSSKSLQNYLEKLPFWIRIGYIQNAKDGCRELYVKMQEKLYDSCRRRSCLICNKRITAKKLCEECDSNATMCENCKNELNSITWTNGQKVIKGGNGSGLMFCSNKTLPAYFKFQIKVHEAYDPNNGYRFIGISENQCDEIGGYYNKSKAWWAIHNNHGAWSKSNGYKGRGTVTYSNAGDIVTVIYDRTKTIRFEVNGISTAQAFDNVDGGPFYLACVDGSNSHYEILDITIL
eukprot:TRINITY_DN3688_c0_g1_i1.p1 TRINITY_DN3688_c0_g1~~TRINITY_DN3688_c0_g1_i1.p1  ORF type:complete len:297 (-),score=10.33 TRINITY_DN3688_c0_g1_i1:127-1017(-)